ncbi:MAG: GNAT family N-acetyltransferase [Clostridia bacterium]
MIEIIKDKISWDEIIQKFDNVDIYYTFEYLQPFVLHGDGQPMLFYYHTENVMAINVVMKRVIELDRENKYYDIITPYGYGGWLIQGNIAKEEIKHLDVEYTKLCQENNIISEFVRFHPLLENAQKVNDIYKVIDLGQTVAIDLDSEEKINENIKSKYRNVIRKAINAGVVIKKDNSAQIYDKFIEIYNATMERDIAEAYYYFEKEFYDSIREGMNDCSTMYYAELDGKVIGASIIMWGKNYVHYHLSGAIREYMNLAPMNLLLYTVACDYVGKKQKLHLGGGVGSNSNSGLYKFKKSFNKNGDHQFSIGKKIFDVNIYNKLVNIRKGKKDFDENSSFFPLYRG